MRPFPTPSIVLVLVGCVWPFGGYTQPTEPASTAPTLRTPLQKDLRTPAPPKAKRVWMRTAEALPEGGWAVRIDHPHGPPFLRGTYADSLFEVPHGTFTYYHPNGSVESTGLYDAGRKTGAWRRFTPAGQPRPVRMYDGLDWEGTKVKHRLASRARTLEAPDSTATPPDDR